MEKQRHWKKIKKTLDPSTICAQMSEGYLLNGEALLSIITATHHADLHQ